MTARLFNGDEKCVGNITSCGTESLMLALKTYRDYRGGRKEIIMCTTGHPAINKGCHFAGLEAVQIPYGKDKKMSVKDLKKVISSNTCVVVCSAPQYPHGVIDDV
jgi:sphinganine-1-phosphate aldolase